MRILVAEPEINLSRLIERDLVGHGHTVETASRGDRALQLATEQRFDVVIMDRALPALDGTRVCQRLRDRGVTSHVIILSKDASIDARVTGLDSGADDYMAKPFALRELHARLRAAQRKGRSPRSVSLDTICRVGPFELDTSLGRLTNAGQEIPLQPKELAIVELLMRNPGRLLTRSELLDAGWPDLDEPASNVLDVAITRVRRRLGMPYGAECLRTIRGRGYVFSAP